MRDRPDFIRHWRDLEGADDAHYPDNDELLSIGAPVRPENRTYYPMNRVYEKTREDAWADAPTRVLGGHDGKARAGMA